MKQQAKFIKRHLRNFIKRAQKRRSFVKLCKKLPLDSRLIFFETFQGRGFSDSPKAVYLYMLNSPTYQDYNFVISLNNPDSATDTIEQNERTSIVEAKSEGYYRLLAQSKFIISNSIFDLSFKKRKEQFYIQTWHGTPLKRIGWDIKTKGNNVLNRPYQIREMYRQDAIRYDLVTSPSPYFSKVFTSAFALAKWNKEKTIIETGYPRNDVLIKHSPEDAKHLRKKYGIAENKKIVLYAPTWREDKHTLTRGYEFDLKFDLDRLRKQFGETHFFIFKMHQFVSDYLNIPHDEVFRDLSSVSDINELFIISDVLITDYSSVFFDFALLQRPILYYMYDLEKYRDETRGFYLDVHSLPGPVLTTEEELLQSLANINHLDDKTAEQLNRFNQIYNPLEDGNSSKRVIDSFLQLS